MNRLFTTSLTASKENALYASMFGKAKKQKITDASELSAFGLKLFHRNLTSFRQKFTFESPAAICNTLIYGKCSIGYLSYIRQGATIAQTDIGRFCSIAPGAFFGGGEHPTNWLSTHSFQYGGGTVFSDSVDFTRLCGRKRFSQPKGRICIGNDVWIGQGATISRGVTIGDGAVVAAKAVVTKNVAPYTIVGGIPARPIRLRFTESVVNELLKLQWWKYDISPIAQKVDYSNIERAIQLIQKGIQKEKIHPLKPARYTLIPTGDEFFIK